ncbi:MAG: sugar ABC transporter permease [Bacilli bacterium]|nr:sugar ABC transporter permease [Bacilli bacterium]MDY6430628.1 sugar ABC transporter permease [Bacilli bacterium]
MESKNNWKAWLYLAPVIILLAVFTFYPIIQTVLYSFYKDYNYITGIHQGFTAENYTRIFTDPYAKYVVLENAIPNTLLLTFITVPLSIFISLAIAIGLNSIKFLKKLFQTIFFMPYVTNAIAIGMVFSIIFDTKFGVFNTIFGTPGKAWIFPNLDDQVFPSYWAGLFATCFYIIWHSLPYKILIFLGGLQNIDAQYYDAAKIDGASKFKTVRRVTIPLLSPQILYIMITSFIGAFKEYNSVIGLFGSDGGQFEYVEGQPDTMKTIVFYIYENLGSKTGGAGHVEYASAVAVMLFALILAFTGIQFLVSKRRVHY